MMAAESPLAMSGKLDTVPQGPDASIDPFASKALNSYKAQKQGELSFKRINILRQVTLDGMNHMYFGECNGKSGWFPSFYVQADPSLKLEIKPTSKSKKMLNFSSLSNSAHAIGSAISNSTRAPLVSLVNSFASPREAKAVRREESKAEVKSTEDGSPGKRKRFSIMAGYTVPEHGDEDSSEKRQRSNAEQENDTTAASPIPKGGSFIGGSPNRPGLRRAPAYMNLRRQASVANAVRAPSTPVVAHSTHPRDSPNWKGLTTSPVALKATREDGPVFLADAETLVAITQYSCPTLPVPLFIRRAVRHVFLYGLGDEGLFRVPGVQTRLNEMIEKINAGEDLVYSAKDDSKEPCDLLKRWCKLTDGPLISGDLAKEIMGTLLIEDEEAALDALQVALQKLPPARLAILKEVSHLGHQVIINSRVNRMDETAMTILWAHNLLRATGDTPDMKSMKSLAEFKSLDSLKNPAAKKNVCALLFRHPRRLFGAPDFSEYAGTGDSRVEFRKKLVAHKTSITAMCQVGQEMWTAGSQGTVHVFDISKGRWLRQLPSAKLGSAVTQMQLAHKTVFCTCPESATVLVRSTETGEVIDTLPAYAASVVLVGAAVWIGSVARIIILDAKTRKEIFQAALPAKTEVLSLLHVGDSVWAGCSDRMIRVFDAKTAVQIREFAAHDRPVTCMVSNGKYVFTCTNSEPTPIAWDAETSAKVSELAEHRSRVGALLVVGNELWSADWEHRICAWDTEKLEWLGAVSNYHVEFISGIQLVWNPKRGHYQIWSCSGDRSINVSDLIAPAVAPPTEQ